MFHIPFILAEALKALGLAVLGLVAAKAVKGLRGRELGPSPAGSLAWIRGTLYAAIVALALLGARELGVEVSAGFRATASEDNRRHSQVADAYWNALRAVELRPAEFPYWRDLSVAKFQLLQFDSVLKDEPVFRGLRNGHLDDETNLRFAFCHYYLGHYDEVLEMTEGIIQRNRSFAAPNVLEGMTYMAQKRYAKAQQKFLEVLQTFPTEPAAVEGLAHAHYLMGDAAGALEVLNATAKFPFAPEARKRFEALKVFYAQP